MKVGPEVFFTELLECLVLAEVSGEDMIMFVLKDFDSEFFCVRHVDFAIHTKESFGAGFPAQVGFVISMCQGSRVRGVSFFYVIMEPFNVHNNGAAESGKDERSCTEGYSQLFICEYRSEILQINTGVVATPLF